MSKAGDFVKKIEDEIESIFSGGRKESKGEEGKQEGRRHSDIIVESDNLAIPEIHVGRSAHKAGEHSHGGGGRGKEDRQKEEKDQAGDGKHSEKLSIRYDTLAMPEIHVNHKK